MNKTDEENNNPRWNEIKPPRFDYSPDELQSLLGDIDRVVSACRAEEKGISPEDMIKTIRGGKVVWITRDQMNKILAKQRKVSGVKFVQRSVRGEDSMSSEISARGRACQLLVETIRKASPDDIPELSRKMRNLEIVLNRSTSLAHEIQLLEFAIERKKSEDPVLREMDRATADMLAALENECLEEAELCQMYSDRHADEFAAKHKRVEPYLNKARNCRAQFIKAKSSVYRMEFDIIARGEEILSAQMQELLYHDKQGTSTRELIELAKEIHTLLAQGRPVFEELKDIPHEQLVNQTALFQNLDKEFLRPLFAKMTEYAERFQKAWIQWVDEKEAPARQAGPWEPSKKKSVTAASRMAFQEEKESQQ